MRRRLIGGISGINFVMAAEKIKEKIPEGILLYESEVQKRSTV